MERKLFSRISLLISICVIALFVACSFSFFEKDIILNNNPKSHLEEIKFIRNNVYELGHKIKILKKKKQFLVSNRRQ